MSATRSATEANVRLLIDDSDPEQYAISSVRMHQIVQGQMQLISQRTHLPIESVLAVSLVAGTYDYTLTGVVGDIRQIVRDSDGIELSKVGFEDLVAIWRQDTQTPMTRSTPLFYAPFETSAQLSRIRVAPTPAASGTLRVYYGIIATALTADSSTIPFSAPLLRALEKHCAAECCTIMSQADRDARMISRESAALWREMAEQGIREENWRMRVVGANQERIIEVDR